MRTSRIAQIVSGAWMGIAVFSSPAVGQVTTRVSVDAAGVEGDLGSGLPAISADGRVVAFVSSATNLVAGDTNGAPDVFVFDRVSGQVERVSVDSSGRQAERGSDHPAISADGRFVAYGSSASNLVDGDWNLAWDVFVHDRVTGITERVSVDSSGREGNAASTLPAISADGTAVVYVSNASNLVDGDANGSTDVFVHDRATGVTDRISVDSAGKAGNGESVHPSISADGRFVAFGSRASNLVADDTNGWEDVFVHDRDLRLTVRVSLGSSGAQGNGSSYDGAISADGRFVAFSSSATNLVSGDTNGWSDVFVHDSDAGTLERVSVDSSGAEADRSSGRASISADGAVVAFASIADDVVDGDTNHRYDVFVHDRATRITGRVNVASSGAEAGEGGDEPSISADGWLVAFSSESADLVYGDGNDAPDVFVHDRHVAATWYNYGTGFPGTLGVPPFTSRADPVLGSTLLLDVADSSGDYTVGLLFLGYQRAAIPSNWGGDLLVAPAITWVVGLCPWGNCFAAEIPDDATLAGLLVDLQALELDPGAAKGVAFTPGLELRLQQ